MNRKIDIKALVSYIIKGDGIDKCRLCMGDTQDGEFHLSETVVLEGEKPVILAELLAVITGVQVELEDLPMRLCHLCHQELERAFKFRAFVRQSEQYWNNALNMASLLPEAFLDTGTSAIIDIRCNTSVINESEPRDRSDSDTDDSESDRVYYDSDEHEPKKIAIQVKDSTSSTGFKWIRIKRRPPVVSECPDCKKKLRSIHEATMHVKLSNKYRCCKVCGVITPRESLLDHVKSHPVSKTYPCRRCDNVFLSLDKYKEHNLIYTDNLRFPCSECCASLSSKEYQQQHIQAHKLKSCPGCNVQLNSWCYTYHLKDCTLAQNRVKVRLRKTPKIKMFVKKPVKECISECPGCGKKLRSLKEAASHVMISNSLRACQLCGLIVQKDKLRAHIEQHNYSTMYPCDGCDNVFFSFKMFKKHKDKSENPAGYPCSQCCSTPMTKESLQEHHEYHKTKPCPGCCKLLNYSCYVYHVRKCSYIQNSSEAALPLNNKCLDCGKMIRSVKVAMKHTETSQSLRTCQHCGLIMRKEFLLEHCKGHNISETHECTRCSNVFMSLDSYNEHIDGYNDGKVKCLECCTSFTNKLYLQKHHLTTHKTKICPMCFGEFNPRCHMYHIKHCQKNKSSGFKRRRVPFTNFTCDYCNKSFKAKNILKAHILLKHMKIERKKEPCAHCGEVIIAAGMKEHIKVRHAVRTMMPCKDCGRGYLTIKGLRQHIFQAHTGEKPYKCPFCDEGFSGSNRRSTHIKRVHKNIPRTYNIKCKSCTRTFFTNYDMRKHMESVHGKFMYDNVYKCDLCQELFYTVHSLLNHKRTLHMMTESEVKVRMDTIEGTRLETV